MRQKNEYALSTGELGTPTRTVDYGYGNADWQDQLTSYNGSAITYDAIGNPTIWYNGMQMTWQKGRQLTDLYKTNTGSILSYTYDDSGLRTSKTMNGVKTEYYRSGSRLIGQKRGSNVMQFLYDANGLYGFLYNGTPHYYVYNGQGDVVRLISASGATEAMYTYDAWGKPLSVTDASGSAVSDASHIANVNPLRYRGYYYDVETGFYYLQSRYYDPEVGRFINADGLVSTGQGVLGYNMYAYCGNNPVNRADPTGEFGIFAGLIAACTVIGGVVGAFSAAATGGNIVEGIIEGALTGAASAVVGTCSLAWYARAAIGFGVGFAIDSVAQGCSGEEYDLGRAVKVGCQTAISSAFPGLDEPRRVLTDAVGTAVISADVSIVLASADAIVTNVISTDYSPSYRRNDRNTTGYWQSTSTTKYVAMAR